MVFVYSGPRCRGAVVNQDSCVALHVFEESLLVLTLIVEKPFLPQQRTGVNHITFESGIPRHVESYCHELCKVKSGHGLIDIHLRLTTIEVYVAERAGDGEHIRTPRPGIGKNVTAHLEHDIRVCQ